MDNLRREFDAAWASFQNLESLRLLPDTLESEWMRGRDSYLAFLIRVTEASVVAHLRNAVRGMEAIPGVEAYPENYWHITIKGIGFEAPARTQPDDIKAADIPTIAGAARRVFAAQPVFDVSIGRLSAFAEVVFAEVDNGKPIRELNGALLATLPSVVRYPFDGAAFLPHVSIARFTSDEGLPRLKETIAGLRDGPAGPTLRVEEIELVRAHLSERAPRLEAMETYSLARDA